VKELHGDSAQNKLELANLLKQREEETKAKQQLRAEKEDLGAHTRGLEQQN
jgi:hypothetical protein